MIHNIFEIIQPSVRDYPERTAIVTPDGEPITYRRLAEIIDGFAVRTSQAGISKGDYVSLHAVSMTQYLCMLFALSKLGAVYVRAPDEDGHGIKADHVLVDSASGLSGPNIIAMDFSWPSALATGADAGGTGFDHEADICLIMGTSGTTGHRKQLGFSLALIQEKVEEKCVAFGPLARRTLLHIPPTTPFGLQIALLTLRSGGVVVLPKRTQPLTLSLLLAGGVDEIFAPPAAYSAWIEQLKTDGVKLRSLTRAVTTGSFAGEALVREVQTLICENVVSNYGSSEMGICAYAHVEKLAAIAGAVGKVADWIDVRVIDDGGNELPRGQMGRLEFRPKPGRRRAPYVGASAGPNDSAEDWFSPGDIGTVTQDGMLCIQGRTTDLMNVGGNKISPASIEDVVNKFLGTTEPVCALGVAGPQGFDEVVVVVSTSQAKRIAELPKLIEGSNLGLGRVHFLAIKTFPLNEFGKVDRTRLREMASAEITRQRQLNPR